MNSARTQAAPRGEGPDWRQRLALYARLARLHRPIGILLLLWPMLWALWMAAGGVPNLDVLAIFVLGTVLMRSAGCVINDYADRNFDGHVERTRTRPLATGAVSEREALTVFVVLLALAALLVLATNTLTVMMSFGGALLAITYPFAKRYTHLPQVHLGAAFGWAVPMAYTAQSGDVTPMTWLLFSTAVLWAVIYDTEYAMVDRDDDLTIGIRTSAITLGRFDVAAVMLFYALFIAVWGVLGATLRFGPAYFAGLAAAALIAAWHFTLIRDRSREGCFRAFRLNHWIGFVVLVGVVADHSLRGR